MSGKGLSDGEEVDDVRCWGGGVASLCKVLVARTSFWKIAAFVESSGANTVTG
jgi:hypothetical protein